MASVYKVAVFSFQYLSALIVHEDARYRLLRELREQQ